MVGTLLVVMELNLLELVHWLISLTLIVCALKFVLKITQRQKKKSPIPSFCLPFFYLQCAEPPTTGGGGKRKLLFVCLEDGNISSHGGFLALKCRLLADIFGSNGLGRHC